MSIVQVILALACFGIGFLIAESSGSTVSPIYAVAILVGGIGVSMILRHFNNKKDK